jgi:hypothetical protein
MQVGRQRGSVLRFSSSCAAGACVRGLASEVYSLKEMAFTLNVVDGEGTLLKTEAFGTPAGVLQRVEALKQEWTEAQAIQVCANGAPLFSIDLKRDAPALGG